MGLTIEPNERVSFKLAYEDEHLVVVDKPAGLVSTPGKGHESDTLQNGLFAMYGHRLQNIGADRDFGMLQRLDRHASGLIVVALRPDVWESMREIFRSRSIHKYYWAVTRKAPNQPTGVIRRPIEEYLAGRDDTWASDPKRRKFNRVKLGRVSTRGKPSITAYRTLQHAPAGAFVECRAVTGRLHQVRVHLDSIGCSIVGDRFYGPRASRQSAPRLMLHAHRLVLPHPVSGESISIHSPCPKDMGRVLRRLGMSKPGVFVGREQNLADGSHEVGSDAIGEDDAGVGQSPTAT
ncbi:MAG TPA: RluA family pseudouridine synthase [Phycisphaerales bacterium]|nr:RluA family pseudouridine synthase [Phycisphaerales bacterium]